MPDKPRIMELRERRGLTQRQLAEAIGVTETAIANWETGRTGLKWLGRLVRLCDALNCNLEDLVELDPDGDRVRSRITELREGLDLSQRELGRRIGGTATTIANWEKGESGMEWIRQAWLLCETLDCKVSDLIQLDKNGESKNIQTRQKTLVQLLRDKKTV